MYTRGRSSRHHAPPHRSVPRRHRAARVRLRQRPGTGAAPGAAQGPARPDTHPGPCPRPRREGGPRAAATAQGVTKVKIEAENDGALRYVSVYHGDAAAIPEPVRKLLDAQFPGGKILGYESESVAGQGHLFEVEVETQDKQTCEYSAKADGTLHSTECHIDPRALPEPVRTAVEKAHPGVTIKEAEKKTFVGAGEQYEVELDVDGKEHEYYFKPDGTAIRHEISIPAVLEVTVL